MDGLRHSSDGGDTWTTIPHADIPNLDIHNVAVTPGPPHRVVVMVNDDVFLSDDDGDTWRNLNVRQNFPLGYPRGIQVKPGNPQTIYTTFGDTTPGSAGVVMRSDDAGDTWHKPAPARPPQHRDVGRQLPAPEPRLPPGRQPLRLPLPLRGRRRLLGQVRPRIQRNILPRLVPQLARTIQSGRFRFRRLRLRPERPPRVRGQVPPKSCYN